MERLEHCFIQRREWTKLKPSDLRDMTHSIVDPGEYTLDWLVMQAGSSLMKVSNAIGDAGRHRVVRDIHKAVQETMGRPLGTSELEVKRLESSGG